MIGVTILEMRGDYHKMRYLLLHHTAQIELICWTLPQI